MHMCKSMVGKTKKSRGTINFSDFGYLKSVVRVLEVVTERLMVHDLYQFVL